MATDRHFKRDLLLYCGHNQERLRAVTKHCVGEWLRWVGPPRLINAIARQEPAAVIDIVRILYGNPDGDVRIAPHEGVEGRLCLVTAFPPCQHVTLLERDLSMGGKRP